MKTQLSVIVPVFNEHENIPLLYKDLIKVFPKATNSYEIIFVDDGSTDNSLKIIKGLRNKNKRVKYLSFSRNFGHMAAIDAGLNASIGQKVVLMDADLQDPPSVVPKMYAMSMKGFNVVYGVKIKRKESFLRRTAFNLYYKLLGSIASYHMPQNAGTFSLMDRKIVDILVNLPERQKYFSGLRSWTGYRQTGVVYERSARYKGKPASWKRLLKLAFDGLFSFSYIPLRVSSFMGLVFSGVAFTSIIIVFLLRIFWGIGLIGWASTMITILLVSGIQLLTLGIIGEYLARIYEEVKARPKYIVREAVGIKKI